MSTWAIGDIHGCWQTLQRLLDRIRWDPAADELWLVGDLVNRGPASLEVLRWAHAHDDRISMVLGNHDLHLLARARGLRPARPEDRLDTVLEAHDRDDLLAWLRKRPLILRRDRWVMVHAGLWPGWSMAEAEKIAGEVAAGIDELLPRFSTKPKPRWTDDLGGVERLAAGAAALTLMRVVDDRGRPKLGFSGPPGEAPEGTRPWFETSRAVREGWSILFGHWAMMGFVQSDNLTCLDSGCVYGGRLTALRLDDGEVVHQPLADPTED